jgi:L-alanine-DL-glutamate epimerase-like enolase superfamily enzyme
VTIAAVRTHRISAPLHTPFVTALRRTTTAESLIVEIVDSDGRRGFGEAPQVWQVTGASIAGSQACVEEMFAPILLGADPDDLAGLCRRVAKAVVGNESAKSAADIALHDLAARRLGIPLARLLGGTNLKVETDVTLSAGEVDGLIAAAKQRIADGFTVLKLKVGTDAAGDLARIRAVCEAAGPQARVRLDANQGWTPREAVRIINAMDDLPIELVEQPVKREDLDGLAHVTQHTSIPILADETVFTVRELTEVIKRRAADMVNVKLAKCGGLTNARTLLELARAHDMGTCVGSMMETAIGIGAAASLVAAQPTTLVSDLDAAWWLASSPIQGGPVYDGGVLTLPSEPGLGARL